MAEGGAVTAANPVLGSSAWPANWSQLFPDLIVALVIGLFVGIALDIVQRRRAARQAKTVALEGWARLQSRLRPYFDRGYVPRVDTWEYLDGLLPALDELDAHPIHEWSRVLKDPTLQSIVRLEGDLRRFQHSIAALAQLTPLAVRDARPSDIRQTQLSDRNREAENAVRALVFGLELAGARRRLDDPISDEQLLDWAHASLKDRRLSRETENLRSIRESLDRDLESVRRGLTEVTLPSAAHKP